MKTPLLTLILPISALLISCGEEESKTSGSANEQQNQLATNGNDTPSKTTPGVNIAKLNKDLLRAITFKQSDKALAAIKAGATPDAKNRYGLPVIFMAAQMGDSEVVKALLKAGADPNAKIGTSFNTDGVGYAGTSDGTVLGYAAAKGNLQVMQDLIAAGADVNNNGPSGTTPLMQAVDAGNFEVVKYLIDKGANANAKNSTGGTALGQAQMIINPDEQRKKVIELLKQKNQ